MSDDARTDEYRDLLDDVVDGHALDSNQVDAIRDLLDERDSLAVEADRLRARVAGLETAVRKEDAAKRDAMVTTDVWKMRSDRLRIAGDELVAAIVDQIGPDALTDERQAWRAVRGER